VSPRLATTARVERDRDTQPCHFLATPVLPLSDANAKALH
jgi:hypothetical protein